MKTINPSTPYIKQTLSVILALLLAASPVTAEQAAANLQISILGESEQEINAIPGAVGLVSEQDLERSQPFSSNEALRKISGVYVRDEQGLGLRPNISIRGVDGDRSRKVLLLEDGVPIALAPYGESSAYYAPQIQRMKQVEVLKGSGGILYGPQTVGGVLNFISKDAPETETTTISTAIGDNEYFDTQLTYGNTMGDTGVIIDVLKRNGNGPRQPQRFDISSISGKITTPLSESADLTVRFHAHNEEAQLSYLGLMPSEYAMDPSINTAENDWLFVERYGVSATHSKQNPFKIKGAKLDTTIYGYTTKRDWWRQDYDNSLYNQGTVSFNASNGGRNRSYKVVGIEPRLEYGNFKGGLRLHSEEEDNKRINGDAADARTGVIKTHEIRKTEAYALYGQYDYNISDTWTLTPGLRIEHYQQSRKVLRSNSLSVNPPTEGKTAWQTELIPGLGATADIGEHTTFFLGAHRGFAPPRFADAVSSSGEDQLLDAERSWNYEAGLRTTIENLNMQIAGTAFYIDYQNQIVPTSISGGVDEANGGRTRHIGFEIETQGEVEKFIGDWTLLHNTALTFVDARVVGDRVNSQGASLGSHDAILPYAPQQLATIGLGLKSDRTTLELEAVMVGEMTAYDITSDSPSAGDTENANGTKGPIAPHTVVNATITRSLNTDHSLKGYISGKNILNETYIASRRPSGIFPGPERQLILGMEYTIR